MQKLLLFFCFIPFLLSAQPELFLTDAIPASIQGAGTRAPRIALLEGNRPIVYWGKTGANPILYLSIWENGGFGDPIALNTNGIEPDLWGGGLGPQVATLGNTIFVVYENYGEGIYCIKSADGGETFDLPVTAYLPVPGRVATLPSVAIDPAGNPIISFVTTDFSEQNAQYEIARSIDGGSSFLPTTVANTAASGGEVCECCPASIGIVTGDEMYLGFRNNDENIRDIWISKSADGGENFSEATDIDNIDWFTQSCPQSGPDMMVSGDHIFATFFSGENGTNIYFSSLNKATMEAGEQFQIPSFGGPDKSQNFPAIAGNGDTLAVIWQEFGSGGWDIMLAWSVSGPADLLNNFMVIDQEVLSQKQPDIAYQDGLFHIIYEDQRTSRVAYKIASFEEIVSTSIKESFPFSAKVTPNPFNGNSTVILDNNNHQEVNAFLFNSNGQLLHQYETTSETIAINDLSKGLYFLKIQRGDAVLVKRMVAH